ncbi:MAG: zinc-dependent alcohol dehydrogenase [Acidimicrobiales bacterium]
MNALVVERSLARFAAARAASAFGAAPGSGPSPLRLVDLVPPEPPAPGWARLRPSLSGICGSDLATLSGRSSRWFEPVVSFPFVPGHEVVGTLDGGRRAVLEPVLGCRARGVEPPCHACERGMIGSCERLSSGRLSAGLQTGYCADTGGGWSGELVAHESQLHPVPEQLDDEAAVMVEPAACAVHAALAARVGEGEVVVVLGAGTLGLCTVAALRQLALPGVLVAVAKHPHQRRLAADLGADVVAEPGELRRAVRRVTRSLAVADRLSGGADALVDCVGSATSLTDALAVTRPRGRVVLAGMPGPLRVDLTPLWQREIALTGAYTYGAEPLPEGSRRTFDLAFEVVAAARLGRLVSARYPLERYEEALGLAASAGRRGAVKVVFEPGARRRPARREL